MSVDVPTWIAFDPEAPATLPVLPPPSGRVVALLASPAAAEWGPGIAVGIARAWSRAGSRVVLADLGLTDPTLHAQFGEPDGEGVTDVVAFGASPRRVARPVGGETFFLVPAGTVVADVPAVLASPRWAMVCEGFRDAGVLLALYLPTEDPARPSALAVATDAVVLAGEGEDISDLLTDVDVPVRGVFGPAAAGEGEGSVISALAGSSQGPHDLDGPDGHAPTAPEPRSLRPTRGTAQARPTAGSSKRIVVLVVALALVILGVLAAAWLGYLHIPGITPSRVGPPHAVGTLSGATLPG